MRMADLHELTVARLARSIRERTLSPVEVIEAYLKRIDRLDPSLNAWVTIDREGALNKARLLEKELAAGEGSGALCGVPIGVKDIFYTKGIATKAASPLYADFVPTYDATCIDRLKRQGAILLGRLSQPNSLKVTLLKHAIRGTKNITRADRAPDRL